ncbi:hypothetical protein F0562_025810 [Nyssa sinensis]|uniref:TF-B3 domain-containing protein n=1 Tax=Nyssa sinensis TaxID=561372 RepID=A0A5J5B955_9ASTE|nr:hypothetical protein F0562_025810 [Nyssa sinensis]
MGDQARELLFEKKLEKEDVKGDLEIPRIAHHLLPVDEDMPVLDQNDNCWNFKSPAEKRGKRYMKRQWRNFVEKESPKTGDILRYYYDNNQKCHILAIEHLPPIGKVYSIVLQEEKQKKIHYVTPVQPDVATLVAAKENFTNHWNHNTMMNNKKISKGSAKNKGRNRPHCTYCDKPGHTRAKCFRFYGFSPKQANATSATSDVNPTPKIVKHELTIKQYQ